MIYDLKDSIVSKLMTRKGIEVNDLLGGQYSVNKNVRFKTPMLRSNFCDYSGAYVVVKGLITGISIINANKRNKMLTFKNNAPFRSYI